MRYKELNLNSYVKVKLMDRGKDIYYHQYDEINAKAGGIWIKPTMPQVDEDGYTEMQLWEFMRLYGSYMVMGINAPCSLNVLIKEEDLT